MIIPPGISSAAELFDETFMKQAYALALESCGHTRPNPPVGAVVVKDNEVIGRGRHKYCGGDHAEAAALKDCKKSTKGTTLYCTLEPCSKPGRVGACCDAIIAAGVKRVVWACNDPNPKNAGGAMKVLRAAGIECVCLEDGNSESLRNLAKLICNNTLMPFTKHVLTGLPFVTVKLAMSLDGKICDDAGVSQWLSCEDSLNATAKMRETADVVMVGAETLRKDNPSLLCHTKENNDLWRAVISRSGRLPKEAQVFTDAAKDRTLVYGDAVEAVKDLGRRGFMSVLCEGGLQLARALADADLVDSWMTIMCPVVLGSRPFVKRRRYLQNNPVTVGSDVFLCGLRMPGEEEN